MRHLIFLMFSSLISLNSFSAAIDPFEKLGISVNERSSFAILGVAPYASDLDLKKAYRKRIKMVHPDTLSRDTGEATMKLYTEASQLVTEAYKRARRGEPHIGSRSSEVADSNPGEESVGAQSVKHFSDIELNFQDVSAQDLERMIVFVIGDPSVSREAKVLALENYVKFVDYKFNKSPSATIRKIVRKYVFLETYFEPIEMAVFLAINNLTSGSISTTIISMLKQNASQSSYDLLRFIEYKAESHMRVSRNQDRSAREGMKSYVASVKELADAMLGSNPGLVDRGGAVKRGMVVCKNVFLNLGRKAFSPSIGSF